LGHYWPVTGNAVDDKINGLNGLCPTPIFATDRLGVAKSAIRVNSLETAWDLSGSKYLAPFFFTLSMWVNKNRCDDFAPYCNTF
jgi:hypothetical protein